MQLASRTLEMIIYVPIAILLITPPSHAYNFDAQVQAFESDYNSVPIDLGGRIIDEHGSAIVGAQLSLLGWGESLDNDGEATDSGPGGSFGFQAIARANVLLQVEAPGHYPEIVAVDLQRPLDEDEVDLGDIVLHERRFDRARLTFG